MVDYYQVAKPYSLFDEDNRKIVERRGVLFEEDVNGDADEQISEIAEDCMTINIENCKPHHLIKNVEGTSVSINSERVTDEDSDDGDDFTRFETAKEVEAANDSCKSRKKR